MVEISSTAKMLPTAKKWKVSEIVRDARSGPLGDVMFVFGVLNASGEVLQQFEVTKELGTKLQQFGPGAIVKKVFGCGNHLELSKHS